MQTPTDLCLFPSHTSLPWALRFITPFCVQLYLCFTESPMSIAFLASFFKYIFDPLVHERKKSPYCLVFFSLCTTKKQNYLPWGVPVLLLKQKNYFIFHECIFATKHPCSTIRSPVLLLLIFLNIYVNIIFVHFYGSDRLSDQEKSNYQ